MKHHRLNAQAVIACREAKGLTQAGLAALAGISRSAMWQMENGQIQPSAPTAFAIAEVLGVEFSEITEAGEPEEAAS
jgi:DNA-binding XRE family transcriptional regulator